MPPCLGSHGNMGLRHESPGLADLNLDLSQSVPSLDKDILARAGFT